VRASASQSRIDPERTIGSESAQLLGRAAGHEAPAKAPTTPAQGDDAFERGAAKAKVAAARKAAPTPAEDGARITEAQARRIVAMARTAGEAHGAHGFHVVGSVLKECGLAAFPPKAKIDEALLHLTEVVEPSEYDEFVKMVEGWKPRSE